jgi:hypothetical protein
MEAFSLVAHSRAGVKGVGLKGINILLAAQHVRQLVFTHMLGQRQASVVLAARVVGGQYIGDRGQYKQFRRANKKGVEAQFLSKLHTNNG